jgi:hypothetical protein
MTIRLERKYKRECHSVFLQIMNIRYLSLYIFLVIASACANNDEAPLPPEPGYDYFPLNTGQYLEYRVYRKTYFLRPDSILGEVVLDSTERTVYIRVLAENKIMDIEGDSATRFGYYTKQTLEADWPDQADSVGIAKLDQQELIYSINNRTFVKLIFPVKQGIAWNGNKYNTLGEENYLISESKLSYSMDTLELQPVIRVLQSDVSNFV